MPAVSPSPSPRNRRILRVGRRGDGQKRSFFRVGRPYYYVIVAWMLLCPPSYVLNLARPDL